MDLASSVEKSREDKAPQEEAEGAGQEAAVPLRSNFSETAFWQPHLLTGADGSAAVEFTVPDSVTSWRVFVHGVTRDLMGGRLEKEARTVKDLMVRPYLPRFFREGDTAELRVMVNNAGDKPFSGEVALEIFDPSTNENLAPAFGLPEKVPGRPFTRQARRRRPGGFPAGRAGPRRHGRLQGDRQGGSLLGRRAPAAAGPSGPDAPHPVPVRDAQGRKAAASSCSRTSGKMTTRPG